MSELIKSGLLTEDIEDVLPFHSDLIYRLTDLGKQILNLLKTDN